MEAGPPGGLREELQQAVYGFSQLAGCVCQGALVQVWVPVYSASNGSCRDLKAEGQPWHLVGPHDQHLEQFRIRSAALSISSTSPQDSQRNSIIQKAWQRCEVSVFPDVQALEHVKDRTATDCDIRGCMLVPLFACPDPQPRVPVALLELVQRSSDVAFFPGLIKWLRDKLPILNLHVLGAIASWPDNMQPAAALWQEAGRAQPSQGALQPSSIVLPPAEGLCHRAAEGRMPLDDDSAPLSCTELEQVIFEPASAAAIAPATVDDSTVAASSKAAEGSQKQRVADLSPETEEGMIAATSQAEQAEDAGRGPGQSTAQHGPLHGNGNWSAAEPPAAAERQQGAETSLNLDAAGHACATQCPAPALSCDKSASSERTMSGNVQLSSCSEEAADSVADSGASIDRMGLVSLEDLRAQFGKPLGKAAANLGVHRHDIIRSCREHNLGGWPRLSISVNEAARSEGDKLTSRLTSMPSDVNASDMAAFTPFGPLALRETPASSLRTHANSARTEHREKRTAKRYTVRGTSIPSAQLPASEQMEAACNSAVDDSNASLRKAPRVSAEGSPLEEGASSDWVVHSDRTQALPNQAPNSNHNSAADPLPQAARQLPDQQEAAAQVFVPGSATEGVGEWRQLVAAQQLQQQASSWEEVSDPFGDRRWEAARQLRQSPSAESSGRPQTGPPSGSAYTSVDLAQCLGLLGDHGISMNEVAEAAVLIGVSPAPSPPAITSVHRKQLPPLVERPGMWAPSIMERRLQNHQQQQGPPRPLEEATPESQKIASLPQSASAGGDCEIAVCRRTLQLQLDSAAGAATPEGMGDQVIEQHASGTIGLPPNPAQPSSSGGQRSTAAEKAAGAIPALAPAKQQGSPRIVDADDVWEPGMESSSRGNRANKRYSGKGRKGRPRALHPSSRPRPRRSKQSSLPVLAVEKTQPAAPQIADPGRTFPTPAHPAQSPSTSAEDAERVQAEPSTALIQSQKTGALKDLSTLNREDLALPNTGQAKEGQLASAAAGSAEPAVGTPLAAQALAQPHAGTSGAKAAGHATACDAAQPCGQSSDAGQQANSTEKAEVGPGHSPEHAHACPLSHTATSEDGEAAPKTASGSHGDAERSHLSDGQQNGCTQGASPISASAAQPQAYPTSTAAPTAEAAGRDQPVTAPETPDLAAASNACGASRPAQPQPPTAAASPASADKALLDTRPPKKKGRPPAMVSHPRTGELVRRSELKARRSDPETAEARKVKKAKAKTGQTRPGSPAIPVRTDQQKRPLKKSRKALEAEEAAAFSEYYEESELPETGQPRQPSSPDQDDGPAVLAAAASGSGKNGRGGEILNRRWADGMMDNLSTPTSRAKGPGIITPIPRRFHAADQDMDMVCMERLPDQLPGCPESGLQGFLADALNFSPGPLLPGGTFGGSLGVSPLRRLQENEHQMFFGGCLGDIGGPSLGDLGTGAFPDIAETSFSFGCFS